jgi:SpoVK/Ycf46/Vps4 family AAA+-type ATPase
MLNISGSGVNMDAEQLLANLFADGPEYPEMSAPARVGRPIDVPEDGDDEDNKKQGETHTQWALGGNGRYIPVGSTKQNLVPGIYEPFSSGNVWGLERMTVASDTIHRLPDMATDVVMKEVESFWENEARYRKHHLLYKRGILLWGDPGSGKTVTVKILMNELVKHGGIVLVAYSIGLTINCLKAIRRIEPERNLIVVLEDIDEIIQANGESQVLSMLDGESNIDRVLNLATTNYPERLGARIVNRPSRFDRRIYVGMPSIDARHTYLEKTTGGELPPDDLKQWVIDTEGMSIAHLRELVAAVYCLGQDYTDVIERLKAMAKPVSSDGMMEDTPGFTRKKESKAWRGFTTPSITIERLGLVGP